jgi:hypothetical protein
MPISYNLKIGKPDVTQDASAHTSGIRQGNSPTTEDPGQQKIGQRLKATARRSTGINPEARNPISPGAPNLPPA